MALVHLREAQIYQIALCATVLNSAFPPSEAGIKVPEGLDQMFAYLDSPELGALNEALRALSPEARHELMALMWLGRGDSGDDFDVLLDHARVNLDAGDINYIAATAPSLPAYLERGLAKL